MRCGMTETHNIPRLDARPAVETGILVITLHKDLPHNLYPCIHALRLDIREYRYLIPARFDRRACAVRSSGNAELCPDGDFV